MPPYRPAAERFWSKVDKNGPLPSYRPELGPCWLWIGAIEKNGYGKFHVRMDGNKTVNTWAHIFGYESIRGLVPDGKQLDHLCRVRSCIRFGHLEPVTQQENMARGFSLNAINRRKTHCLRGHPLDASNVYLHPKRGHRMCRACQTIRNEEVARKRRLGLLRR